MLGVVLEPFYVQSAYIHFIRKFGQLYIPNASQINLFFSIFFPPFLSRSLSSITGIIVGALRYPNTFFIQEIK